MYWLIFMLLFSIGIIGIILNRSNIIIILMSIELILLAIIYVFLLDIKGSLFNQIFVIMILTVAAAEAAIGLAILVAYFRIAGTIAIKSLCLLYGLLTIFPGEAVRKELIEVLPICALFYICVFLSAVIFGVSYWLGEKLPNKEKVSAYECGFNPINNMGQPFSIRFFLIGVLFLVFDLEVSFVYPWSVSLQRTMVCQYVLLLIFLVILIIGLFYEWIKGGLEWE